MLLLTTSCCSYSARRECKKNDWTNKWHYIRIWGWKPFKYCSVLKMYFKFSYFYLFLFIYLPLECHHHTPFDVYCVYILLLYARSILLFFDILLRLGHFDSSFIIVTVRVYYHFILLKEFIKVLFHFHSYNYYTS